MSDKKSTCQTCLEFITQGYSDSVEDMGEHMNVSHEISNIVNGRNFINTGDVELDAWKPCDICESVTDKLFVFDVAGA